MPAFFTTAHIRLSLLLAILGGLVALVFTIFSDSGVVALVFRPLVSALVMFVVGTGIYALLANKVPEAIDAIENKAEDMQLSQEATHAESAMGEGDMATGEGGDMSDMSMDGPGDGSRAYDSSAGGTPGSNIPRKAGVQVGKEEIIVDGVKFKNQPDVMAETIKQLMDQDKD